MIRWKCARCGHQVEVSEAARKREITCPRCGQLMSSDPAADAVTVSAQPFSASSAAGFFTEAPTHKEPDDEETFSPLSSGVVEAFSFLSPAQGPNEMGWLAHYRVVRLLGQGGMGIVFEAIDMQLQRPVALKVMKPDIAKDESARQRFLREARAMASVRSDHVVVIHQVDQDNGVPFLAMEFLHGEPLDRWLERHGRPSLEEALRIGMEIARGLAAAHERGLIHRDIKPANIWLETALSKEAAPGKGSATAIEPDSARIAVYSPRKSFRVKILDFGLARIAREKGHLTQTGFVLGTPAYMAPEQAEGGEIDARSDLFSLGCVLYELATGARPFSGTNTMAVLMAVALKDPLPPLQLNPDLPPAFGDIILHLLAKKPHDRPASAHEVVASLQSVADEMGISGQTPTSGIKRGLSTIGPLHVTPPHRKLMIGLAVVGGVVAVALLGGLLFALLGTRDKEFLLGMSGPLNGPSKELGREMEIGIKTYIRHINDEGGVRGRKLRLVALDDGYEPDMALANMKELHEQRKVFGVIGNIGTPTAIKTVPYAIQNKLLFFGAFTGAKLLRNDPPDRYVFNYRASYEEETAKIVEYLVEIKKVLPEQIAVFDQNDGYGDAGFNGVVKVMRSKYQRDSKDIFRVRYERNTIHVKDAVDKILEKPTLLAVVMVGTYKPVTEFIRQVKDANRNLIFTNVSFVGSEALAEGLKELGPKYAEDVIITQVVPPIDSSASIVLKYHELRKKYFPNERPSFTSLEGYISTALFVEGLKRAGPNPTPERMIDALETIHDLDLGTGAPLTFSASEHQASHKVWATILDKAGNFKVLDMTN
jgi:serine/threonine protein kinase/ABC-type branched-subunit amino acid transport system substrate-binding protein